MVAEKTLIISSSRSTVSKVESVSTYFKKKNAQAESQTSTKGNMAHEPDSPYKNLIKTEIKVNLDDSTEDAADFKSPVLIRKPNNLHLNKAASQRGRQKSKTPAKKRNKQISKKSAGKNYTIKIIEDNFKLFGENPEQMQMAMALSKSSYEAEHGCQSPSKEEMPDVGELLRSSKPTFLERFGFTSAKAEKRKPTEVNKKIRNRFKYITPILNIRTKDQREALIESKISLILSQENLQPKKLFKHAINSTLLHNFASKENSIFKLDRLYEKNHFYVNCLNIPRNKAKCGCMLKSWDLIIGRDKSPCKNKTNPLSEQSSKNDSVKPFSQTLTKSPEISSNDNIINSDTKVIKDTVTAVTQTVSFNAENRQVHIKTPVKNLTDTLDVGACCSFTTSKTSQVNVGSFESESKDSAIATSLSSSPRLTVPSFSSSMRSISPDLFASDEEFSEQITIETESKAYCHSISRQICRDIEQKKTFVGNIDARTEVRNVFDSNPSQAYVSYNVDKPENSSFNEVIDLTDDDDTINKSVDNSETNINTPENIDSNSDSNKDDCMKLNIFEKNTILEGTQNKLLGDSFKSKSNDSPLKNNQYCDSADDKSISLLGDNDSLNFSNQVVNDGKELLDTSLHNASVVEDKDNNTKENEIIDLTDDDDSFSQRLNKSLLPDKQTTRNEMENSCVSALLENITKKKIVKRKTDIYSLREFEIEMEFDADNEGTFRDFGAIGNGNVEINKEYVKLLKNKYKKDAFMENNDNDSFSTDNNEKGITESNLLNINKTSRDINNFKEAKTVKDSSSGSLESPSKNSSTPSSPKSCIYDNHSDSSPNIIEKETDAVQDLNTSIAQSISDKDPFDKIINNKIGQQGDYYDNEQDASPICEQTESPCFDEPVLYDADNVSNNTSKSSQQNISSQSTDKNYSCQEFDNNKYVQDLDYNKDNKNSSLDETPKRNQRSKSPFFDEPVLYDSAHLDVTDYVINMLDQENFSFDKTKRSINGGYTNIRNVDLNDDEEMPLSQESQSSVIADEELNYSCHFATPSKSDRIEKKEFNDLEMKNARPLSPENELPNTRVVSKPTPTKSLSVSTPDNFIIKTVNVTPMPDYDQMATPLINNELQKYGLKPLKRTRGTKLLKYIYDSTHPLVPSDQHVFDASESDEDKRVIKRRKKDDRSSSSIQAESLSGLNSANSLGVVGDKIIENENLEDLIFERKQSVRIPSCKVPLQIVWHNLISSHPEIKENILLYEPLQLESLHLMIKEQGYKFHIQDLLTFLDKKCITIRTAQKQGKAHR